MVFLKCPRGWHLSAACAPTAPSFNLFLDLSSRDSHFLEAELLWESYRRHRAPPVRQHRAQTRRDLSSEPETCTTCSRQLCSKNMMHPYDSAFLLIAIIRILINFLSTRAASVSPQPFYFYHLFFGPILLHFFLYDSTETFFSPFFCQRFISPRMERINHFPHTLLFIYFFLMNEF